MPSQSLKASSPDKRLADIFDLEDGLQSGYEALAELIHNHDRFLVVAHVGPDGDAIGSTLGLCHLLWGLGKQAVPFNADPVPFNFAFFDGADRFVQALAPEDAFDVTIVLDCAEPGRVGESFPPNGWGAHIAVVDHHLTWDPDFASLYVRDTNAAAVGEMIFRLALTLGARLDRATAECCYTSLMTDTGGFRYGKTSTTTFLIASHLLTHGVDPWRINSHVYENEPLSRMRLLARVLDTLDVSACGRLAFVRVDGEMLAQTGATSNMLDGFINYARQIKGVEVATQLRQIDQGSYKVSFRSSGAINVAALAEAFGGGGHHNAAGCVIAGDAPTIQAQLADRLSALLS